MSNIQEFKNIPDISFINNMTLEEVRDQIMNDYRESYKAETGKYPDIQAGSPERLFLNAFAAQFYQGLQFVDIAGKSGLLKYSFGGFLDNLGAIRSLTRFPASSAMTTFKFTLSTKRASATGIPGGTRVTTDGGVYFATDEYLEIPAGELTGTVCATAQNAGSNSNGLQIGEIYKIVDPIAYVDTVENISVSNGGADIENDDTFTRRIFNSPAGWSVAGPTDAYNYHAKNAIANIGDVRCYSPAATQVSIVFIMNDGSLPTEEQKQKVLEYVNSDEIRPLTDQVTVSNPVEVNYSINIKYYINREDSAQATTIQAAIEAAIDSYKQWQRKIGRDITPSKLIQLCMQAGAKRVEVTSPTFVEIDEYKIAKATTDTRLYGGLEDD